MGRKKLSKINSKTTIFSNWIYLLIIIFCIFSNLSYTASNNIKNEKDESEDSGSSSQNTRENEENDTKSGKKMTTGTTSGALTADGGSDSDSDLGDDQSDDNADPSSGYTVPQANPSYSGSLTQAFPLRVLPGRHNRHPNLILVYNSQNNQNGIVGYGWSLDIGTIVRGTKRGNGNPVPFKDIGTTYATSYDPKIGGTSSTTKITMATDRYTLNIWGNAMELVYDEDDGLFHSRYENGWRVKFDSTSKKYDNWIALAPDGYKYTFISKSGGNSNVLYLDKIESPEGYSNTSPLSYNNTFIEYATGESIKVGSANIPSNMLYPMKIFYSCQSKTASNCYKVEFVYEPRVYDTDLLTVINGQLTGLTLRLSTVMSKTPAGAIALKYKMKYGNDNNNWRSMLKSIQLQDKDGNAVLPPTSFKYQEAELPNEDWDESKASGVPTLSHKFELNMLSRAMLKNGCPFHIPEYSVSGFCGCSIIDPWGNISVTTKEGVKIVGVSFNDLYDFAPTLTLPLNTGVFFVNLNNDGLPDLVNRSYSTTNPLATSDCLNKGTSSFECTKPNTDFWTQKIGLEYFGIPKCKYDDGWVISREAKYGRIADINGDGDVEFIYTEKDQPQKVVDLNGNPLEGYPTPPVDVFENYILPCYTSKTAIRENAKVVDLNGDGYSDFLKSTQDESSVNVIDIGFSMIASSSTPATYKVDVPKYGGTWVYNKAWNGYNLEPTLKSPILFRVRQSVDALDSGKNCFDEIVYFDLPVQFVDINGDGLTDIYNMAVGAKIKEGGGSFELPLSDLSNHEYKMLKARVENENGIFLNTGSGWLNVTSKWKVDWSDEASSLFGANISSTGHPQFGLNSAPRWLFLDINGDGLTDIVESRFKNVLIARAGGGWKSVNPEEFTPPSLPDNDEYKDKWIYELWKKGEKITDSNRKLISPQYQFIDINGDSFFDLVDSSATTYGHTMATGPKEMNFRINPLKVKPNLLVEVKNPLGGKSIFSYSTYAKKGEYVGTAPKHIVKQISTWLPDGNIVSARFFSYENPQYVCDNALKCNVPPSTNYDEERGSEFLGFKIFKETLFGFDSGAKPDIFNSYVQGHDELNINVSGEKGRRRVTTEYGTGYAYSNKVMSQKVEITENGAKSWSTVSSVANEYYKAHENKDVSTVAPYVILLKSSETTYHEGTTNEKILTEYFDYNKFGLPGKIVNHGRDGFNDTVTVNKTYTNLTDPWIIGLLSNETIESNGGYKSLYQTYDEKGRIKTKQLTGTDFIGATTTYHYNLYSNVIKMEMSPSESLSNKRVYDYTYKSPYYQFLEKIADPEGNIESFTYYGINASETMANPSHFGSIARINGATYSDKPPTRYILFKYDNFGRVTSESLIRASDNKIFSSEAITYKPAEENGVFHVYRSQMGEPLTLSLPNILLSSKVTFDAFNRTIQSAELKQDGKYSVVDYEYGPFGSIKRANTPHSEGKDGKWATTTVDPLGRPKLIENQIESTTFEYEDFITRVTSKNGYWVEIEKDGQGRIVSTKDSVAVYTNTDFNNNNTITVTGPDGYKTTLEQNSIGLVKKRTDPDRGTWTFDYNNDGNVIKQTDAKSVVTAFKYDLTGRIIGVDWGNNGTKDIEYFYDGKTPGSNNKNVSAVGFRSAMKDPSGETRANFDARGLPYQIKKMINKTWHTATYKYDGIGRITEYSFVNPNQWAPSNLFTAQYIYNLDGLHIAKTKLLGGDWQNIVSDVKYNDDGSIARIYYGNGVIEYFVQNSNTLMLNEYKVEGKDNKILIHTQYEYHNDTGYIKNIIDKLNPKASENFTYQLDGSLDSAKSALYGDIDYQTLPGGYLTKLGNWESKHKDTAHPHAVTEANNIQSGEKIGYTYDKNGNVIKSLDREFFYDDSRRLTSIKLPDASIDFKYDGDNNLVKRELKMGGSPSATPDDSIVSPFSTFDIVNSWGNVSHYFDVNVFGRDVATIVKNVAPNKPAEITYFYTDHLGSRKVITDGTGKEKGSKVFYKPYGVPLDENGNEKWQMLEHRDKMYLGVPSARITNLYVTGPRIFDPTIGKFLQTDPISTNSAYQYASNNPIMLKDPSGYEEEWVLVETYPIEGGYVEIYSINSQVNRVIDEIGSQYSFDSSLNLPKVIESIHNVAFSEFKYEYEQLQDYKANRESREVLRSASAGVRRAYSEAKSAFQKGVQRLLSEVHRESIGPNDPRVKFYMVRYGHEKRPAPVGPSRAPSPRPGIVPPHVSPPTPRKRTAQVARQMCGETCDVVFGFLGNILPFVGPVDAILQDKSGKEVASEVAKSLMPGIVGAVLDTIEMDEEYDQNH